MMKRTLVLVVAVLALAACSSDSKSSSSTTTTTTTATSSSSAGSSTASSSSSTAAGPTTSIGGLKAAQNSTIGQSILVSDREVTLYLYEPDGTGDKSTVSAGIRSSWPAVIATDPADVIITGIDPSKLGTTTQADGTKQLTYNKHLLYTYTGDTSPGQANGQGLGGVWFVLSATGEKIAS